VPVSAPAPAGALRPADAALPDRCGLDLNSASR